MTISGSWLPSGGVLERPGIVLLYRAVVILVIVCDVGASDVGIEYVLVVL